MSFNFLGDIRFEKVFSGPSFSAVVVAKSSDYCPGQIFTLDTDFKTRQYATYVVDDPDASRTSKHSTYAGHLPITQLKKTVLLAPTERPHSAANEGRSASCKIPCKRAKDVKRFPSPDKPPPRSGLPPPQNTTATLRGSYLSKPRTAQGPQTDQHTTSLPEYHALSSSSDANDDTHKKKAHGGTRNVMTGESSNSSSEISGLPPAHQIHNRMMGWKLTSPERRRELLSLLEHAQLSASTVEEDEGYDMMAAMRGQGPRNVTPMTPMEDEAMESRRIAQRQADAIATSIGRLTHKQRRNYRASRELLDRRKKKVSAAMKGTQSEADKRADMRRRPLSPGRVQAADPFAEIIKAREHPTASQASLGKQAVREFKLRQAAERAANESLAGASSMPSDWDFAPPDEPVHGARQSLPPFQAVQRSPRSLLNPADRMEILENARIVEKQQQTLQDDVMFAAPFSPPSQPTPKITGLLSYGKIETRQVESGGVMKNSSSVPEPYLRKVLNSRGESRG